MAFQKRHYFGKGISLIERIEELIGFDEKTGLVKDGSSESMLDSFENSSFGIANFLAGREDVSRGILGGIENYIDFDENGLVYNKIGLSQHEDKKVLPGEKTIYLANNVLVSVLYHLFGEERKAKSLREKIEEKVGTFDFKGEKVYRHEPNKNHFYPFNTLLVGINNLVLGNNGGESVEAIRNLCFDKEMGLLRGEPKGKLYFTLDNSLFATYLSLSGNEEEAEKLIKNVERVIGFDEETGLVYRGALGPIGLIAPRDSSNTANVQNLKRSHPIRDVLTYTNSTLAIAYLTLAGNFPKKANPI